MIDHSTKAGTNDLHPSGSKRKRADITGSSFFVEATQPLTIAAGGKVQLTTAKERHGHYARKSLAAVFELTVWPNHGATWKLWPGALAEAAAASLLDTLGPKILAVLANESSPISKNLLMQKCRDKGLNVRATTFADVIEEAIRRKAISSTKGSHNAQLLQYCAPWT